MNHTTLVLAAAALLMSGCASFSPDGGFGAVQQLTQERTGQTPIRLNQAAGQATPQARIAELLKAPLSADSAVELALLNNRGLQASFADLGIAEADLVQAGRLRGPSLSFARLAGGGLVEIDRAVIFNLLGLITLPAASRIEQGRFEQAQLQAAYEAVGLAAAARRAFFRAVAAQQLVKYGAQVKEAADASNELARRMLQAGNFNKLQQMREQSFYADASAQLARAQHQALAEREGLTRLLGLADTPQAFTLPDRLPDLPAEPASAQDAEQTAMDKRLDVLIARRSAEALAQSLGATQSARWINGLDAGYQNKSQTGERRQNGYVLDLELPLLDLGAGPSPRLARAEASLLQAQHRAADVANNARSEVRESYSAYRTAYDLARHYRDEVVPLRKRISDENLLRYNGMLSSVFELLADARDQVGSVTGYVEALRDHWIAATDLQTALTGRSPDAAGKRNALSRTRAVSSTSAGPSH